MSHEAMVDGAFLVMGTALVSISAAGLRPGVPRSPGRTALAASVGTLGVSFLLQSPSARALQDHAVINLGQLTGNGTSLVAAFLLQVMVLRVLFDPPVAAARARPWLAALVVALVGMVALFSVTPAAPARFTSPDAPGGIVAYYVIFTGYLACTLVSLFALLRRYAEAAADRWLRISLRMYRWSCAAGLAYLAGRLATLFLEPLGVELPAGDGFGLVEFLLATVVPGVCFALCLTALAIKAGGRRFQYGRAERRLRPLWEAARAARPHAVLPVAPPGRARLRLYRRVIEIQDAQLAAAELVDASQHRRIADAVRQEGLAGAQAEAVRAAAAFAAGLAALRAGHPPVAEAAAPAGRPPAPAEREEFAVALDRLERISLAFRDSPIVARFS